MKITPNIRFHIAYFCGAIAAAMPVAFIGDFYADKPTGLWILWVVIFLANFPLYYWNMKNFMSETLWMLIKNPTKEVDPWRGFPKTK